VCSRWPPQLVAGVITDAENTVYTENFKREMMRSRKYRARHLFDAEPAARGALRRVEENAPAGRRQAER
jgi:hypothetical protein